MCARHPRTAYVATAKPAQGARQTHDRSRRGIRFARAPAAPHGAAEAYESNEVDEACEGIENARHCQLLHVIHDADQASAHGRVRRDGELRGIELGLRLGDVGPIRLRRVEVNLSLDERRVQIADVAHVGAHLASGERAPRRCYGRWVGGGREDCKTPRGRTQR